MFLNPSRVHVIKENKTNHHLGNPYRIYGTFTISIHECGAYFDDFRQTSPRIRAVEN